jgi:hypothetical protein
MKPLKKLNIRSTVYPISSFETFNEWIRYIYLESEKRYREELNKFSNHNKIYKP